MLTGKKIVFAEDDEATLESYKTYFDFNKDTKVATIFYVKNVQECRDTLDKELPDWLILDLGLGDINPPPGLKILHDYKGKVKTIVVSGYHEYKGQCMEDGAVEFISKPVEHPKQLIEIMLTHP